MNTQIISAFPGTGKSYFTEAHSKSDSIIDLDSNTYTSGHTHEGQIKNPDFPANYIKAIESCVGAYDILFVSVHKDVLSRLVEKGIEVTLVYPKRELKSEYVNRYKQRGSSEAFVKLLSDNWDTLIDQLESQKGCRKIVLGHGQHISDVL